MIVEDACGAKFFFVNAIGRAREPQQSQPMNKRTTR